MALVGSTRQSAIDFWQGLLGMKFLFEQPNLGRRDESHLYFDPGDGRLITPAGISAADILVKANAIRLEAGAHHINEEHLADAIEQLMI